MREGCIVILDVGKSFSKLTIWSADHQLMERRTYRNSRALNDGLPILDVKGIGFWLVQTLAAYSRLGEITAIIPVGHGAAACSVDEDGLSALPLDYEAEPPKEVLERYRTMRDPFVLTGSPLLPAGLNVGIQFLWLEMAAPERTLRGQIVTWPQYWAWLLSGVAATEATSLGCHTDLWMPAEGKPSPMAVRQGWAGRLAPLRRAADVLGPVLPKWQERCGLPKDCMVVCGLHDSNAALLATRGYPEINGHECTVLSTGTWFVAMRSVGGDCNIVRASLPEDRDCLFNLDVHGHLVPSSRFMGGREAELLEGAVGSPADPSAEPDTFISIAMTLAKAGVFALPAFQKGVGPYPNSRGTWIRRPADQIGRRAVAGLYLALMANASVELIGSKQAFVIEGRFAKDPVFTRAFATLRADEAVYLSDLEHSIPFGALRLLKPDVRPQVPLTRVDPIPCDLKKYAADWRKRVEQPAAEQ